MPLLESTDGILGTAVTWTVFESQIRASLGTEARLGSRKSAVDIGEGNGFVSCCALITCDWVGAATDEKLPAKVVLKIPSFIPLKKMMDALPPGQRMYDDYDEEKWASVEHELRELHGTELATYDYLDEFDGLAIPKRYYGVPVGAEEGGQICLEYLENSRNLNYYDTHSVEQVRQIAGALGKIRGRSLKKEPVAPELCKDFHETVVKKWPLENYRGMLNGLLTVDSSEKTKMMMAKIDEILPFYYENDIGTVIRTHLEVPTMIFNADAHTGNVLVDRDSGHLLALIDWQCTHFGAGVEDLHRILISALTTQERRSATPNLLAEMHASLVENLNGSEPPYSLETLFQLSDLLFASYALFFVGGFVQMLSKQDNDASISDEEKKRRKEIIMDKEIGALEDIVELDEKVKNYLASENVKI